MKQAIAGRATVIREAGRRVFRNRHARAAVRAVLSIPVILIAAFVATAEPLLRDFRQTGWVLPDVLMTDGVRAFILIVVALTLLKLTAGRVALPPDDPTRPEEQRKR